MACKTKAPLTRMPAPVHLRSMKWLVSLLMITGLWGAGLESLSEQELRARAATDDLPAEVELAHRQLRGMIMPFDQKFVLETFRRGSEADIASAHTGLALCHSWAVGMPYDNDPTQSLLLFEKAAEMGDSEGTYRLGIIYHKTLVRAQGPQRGLDMIRKAAGMGSDDALAYLAECMLTGDGVPQDVQAGLTKLLALEEEKGNRQAAVALAFHYRDRARDPKNADKYFRIAAAKNHTAAFIALGDKVLGSKPWEAGKAAKQEGAEWYRKAVARNSAEAMRKLGGLQVRDTTVRKEGEDWYQLWLDADSKGDEIATFKLAEIHYHAPGYFFRDLDWSKSAAFYERYLSRNPRDYKNVYLAVDRLLEMYFNGGQGLERDFKKCLVIAQGHLDLNPAASAYAGRILLHPDAPMGKSREHFIRGYACMLRSRAVWKMQRAALYWISDDALFVLRSRHGMTQAEVARAEELFRQGYPNPETPILP